MGDTNILNTYCWIHSTYSLNDKYDPPLISDIAMLTNYLRFNGTPGLDYAHP